MQDPRHLEATDLRSRENCRGCENWCILPRLPRMRTANFPYGPP